MPNQPLLADAEPAADRQAQDRDSHDGDHDDAGGSDHAEDQSVGGCPQHAPAVGQDQDVGEQDGGDQSVEYLSLHEQLDEVTGDQGDARPDEDLSGEQAQKQLGFAEALATDRSAPTASLSA